MKLSQRVPGTVWEQAGEQNSMNFGIQTSTSSFGSIKGKMIIESVIEIIMIWIDFGVCTYPFGVMKLNA